MLRRKVEDSFSQEEGIINRVNLLGRNTEMAEAIVEYICGDRACIAMLCEVPRLLTFVLAVVLHLR